MAQGAHGEPRTDVEHRRYLIALEPVIISGYFARERALLNPEDPAVGKAWAKHPEWFGEAVKTVPRSS